MSDCKCLPQATPLCDYTIWQTLLINHGGISHKTNGNSQIFLLSILWQAYKSMVNLKLTLHWLCNCKFHTVLRYQTHSNHFSSYIQLCGKFLTDPDKTLIKYCAIVQVLSQVLFPPTEYYKLTKPSHLITWQPFERPAPTVFFSYVRPA